MIDTILLLDVSGSMQTGNPTKLDELKAAVLLFLEITQTLGLGDRIALVIFGGTARILSTLTDDYDRLASLVRRLSPDGATPMAEALVFALKELQNNGRILSINDIQLMPRIILMTDGEPDNEQQALVVSKLIGDVGFPIACVGVTGCKESFLQQIARITGGMFVKAHRIQDLSVFFLQQVYITLYIAKMKDTFENLLNREMLRSFFEQELNCPIDDETLDLIIVMLNSMVRGDRASSRSASTPLLTYPKHRSCCCTIL